MKILLLLATVYFYFGTAFGQKTAFINKHGVSGRIYSKKVSPLLAAQLDIKLSQLVDPLSFSVDKFVNPSIRSNNPDRQRIYLFFKEYPSNQFISELESLDGKIILDSWIPALENHPYGFILAEFPISNINILAEKEYIFRLETAEKLIFPNNDKAAVDVRSNILWPLSYEGCGIRLAVLDSGLDTDHPDIPIPLVAKDNDGVNGGPADYFIMQGTSMACPVAAGAAVLLLNQEPLLTPAQIRDALINNTTSDGYTGTVPNDTWGYGKLNIAKALESILPCNISGQRVSSTGVYSFGTTDISMNFSLSTDDEVVSVAEILAEPPGGADLVIGRLDHVSMIRYWKIGTDKSGFNTTLTFSYDPIVDGIEDENSLYLSRRDSDADPWQEYIDITRDPGNNRITANNVTSFSQWTFASYLGDNSLPVTLTEFTGYEHHGQIVLQWTTESEIEIFNLLGKTIRNWVKTYEPGYHTVTWEGTNQAGDLVATGVYFYRLMADNIQVVKKLILAK
jgi:hypothetical protein